MVAGTKYYARKGAPGGERGGHSPVQPKLFDDSGYVRPDYAPGTPKETKGTQSDTYQASGGSGIQERMLIYAESPSTEKHILQAYRSNFVRPESSRVVKSLEAGRNERAEIERGNYGSLIEALREKGEGSTEKVDIDGSKLYTTPAFIRKFEKKYGFEPPAVGIIIPKEKWEGKRESKTKGVSEKIGAPTWAGGISMPPDGFRKRPYGKTGLIVIASTDGESDAPDHELLHSVYDQYGKQFTISPTPRTDKLFMSPHVEFDLINEMSAYRSKVEYRTEWEVTRLRSALHSRPVLNTLARDGKLMAQMFGKNYTFIGKAREDARTERELASDIAKVVWSGIKRDLKEKYIPLYEERYVKRGFDAKGLETLENSRLDKAIDSVRYMEEVGVPESEITRRLMTVGPTKRELSRHEFYSPLNDVVAWGKRTAEKEVVDGKYKPKKQD